MNDPTIVCPLARLTADPELKQSKTGRQQLRKGMACRVEGVLKWTVGTDNNGQPRVWFDVQFPRISVMVHKQISPQSQQQPQQPQPWGAPQPQAQRAPADPWSQDFGGGFGGDPTTFNGCGN